MKKVVVVGGGTGTFTVLSGLKKYPLELSAVVAMSDNGGSTGILRDELGVLPPGDVRQCLVALSRSDRLMRTLMNYRFANGTLKGHSFGNLLLSALERITGSFDLAVEKASEILLLEGKVLPATLDKVDLVGYTKNGKRVLGQRAIHFTSTQGLRRITLSPKAHPNPKALKAIKEANFVVIGPGDLYGSLIPNLLVPGITKAIRESRAKTIYVANLMTKALHTEGFGVHDYVREITRYLGGPVDFVVYNTERPPEKLLKRYSGKGEQFVEFRGATTEFPKTKFVGDRLVNKNIVRPPKGDPLPRTLIRHNSEHLARLIFKRFILPTLY